MKVAMRRTVLVAVICFAVALVVSAAFLAWFNADPDAAITAVLASMPLNYLYAVSSGIAAFSAGALVALVAGPLAHLRMPKLPRAIFAALGWVVLGFLLLAPIVATAGASLCGIRPAPWPGLRRDAQRFGVRAAPLVPRGPALHSRGPSPPFSGTLPSSPPFFIGICERRFARPAETWFPFHRYR